MKTKELYRAQISAHVEVAILMLFIGYSLWSLTTRFRLSKDATKGEREVEFTIVCQPNRIFLSAEWRHLLMLNYVVEPDLLLPYVPPGTSLDSFCGRTYVSLVGFRFTCTRLFGFLPVPFHTNFDEVNLRLYVRRKADDEHRRGVVFIAEVVPRRAIATIARLVYGENYTSSPMRHQVAMEGPKKPPDIGGGWVVSGANSPLKPRARRSIRPKGVWNSSSRNTTGDIQIDRDVHVLNTRSRTIHGKCGPPLRLNLKGTLAASMDANSERHFNDVRIPHL